MLRQLSACLHSWLERLINSRSLSKVRVSAAAREGGHQAWTVNRDNFWNWCVFWQFHWQVIHLQIFLLKNIVIVNTSNGNIKIPAATRSRPICPCLDGRSSDLVSMESGGGIPNSGKASAPPWKPEPAIAAFSTPFSSRSWDVMTIPWKNWLNDALCHIRNVRTWEPWD